jgi:hypothetical protein
MAAAFRERGRRGLFVLIFFLTFSSYFLNNLKVGCYQKIEVRIT